MATPSKKPPKKTAAKVPAKRSQAGTTPGTSGAARTTRSPKRAPRATEPPASGPVSLEQAKAIVAAGAPMRSAAPARSGAGPRPADTAPGDVARERRQLRLAQRREHKRRIQEYKAVMQVMKRRGVRGLAPTPAPAQPGGAASPAARAKAGGSAGAPLQILAEGDSWFDYPVPLFGGGIITRLERQLGIPILNLAKAGDEVRYMMGVSERTLMAQHLREGCPSGGAWDVLLFSGGGNDIVDDPMALWVRDYDASLPPAQLIHRARFDMALAIVRAGYEDLISLRDQWSPGTQLVFHAYDFALPDGRGICHLGPWLKPTFDLRRFPTQQSAFDVVKLLLSGFSQMLQSLQSAHTGVTIINGQGTLAPQPGNWHNEMHPSKQGFEQFATLFLAQLKVLFPNRVPS